MKVDNVILELIQQLKMKIPANGATEAEAMSALTLAQKLMQKHGVTESDLNRVDFSRDMHKTTFTQTQKQIHPVQKFCAVRIGEFCGVRVWLQNESHMKKNLAMFGMNGDVEMANFLFGLIHNSMDRAWKEYLAENKGNGKSRHTEYWSFMTGFSSRINSKLREMTVQTDSASTADSASSVDLVVMKDNVVDDGLEALFPNLKLKSRNTRAQRINGSVFSKGTEAGDKVNLGRPLAGKRSETQKSLK